jgi:methyl-accepting chemotaxis protein
MLATTDQIAGTMQQVKDTSDKVNQCSTDLYDMIHQFKIKVDEES